MSIPVGLDEIRSAAKGQAPFAYLLTVSDDESAHVIACVPEIGDATIGCAAGKTSVRNVGSRPRVSLLWPPATFDDYSLIVDGDATAGGDGTVTITPTRAVRHRPAVGGGNDCIRLDT